MAQGCDTCRWAVWKKTSNGRLHPDKTGRCSFVWSPPPIPLAFSFSYQGRGEVPKPSGGYIERGHAGMDGCPCWADKLLAEIDAAVAGA